MQVLANIDVADLERAVSFYTDALGLGIGRRFGGGAVELVGPSFAIYLLQKESHSAAASGLAQQRDYARHWTPVHLDFVVPEIHGAVARAVATGARLEVEVRTHNWGHIAVLADPFGHGFCLIEFRGRGYDEIVDSVG